MRVISMLVVICGLAAGACARNDDSSHGNAEAVPTRTNEIRAIGTIGGFDVGDAKPTIDLSETRADLWGTTTCHVTLPADLVIGSVTCHENTALTADLHAGQAYQYCSGGDTPVIAPQSSIQIDGCESATYDIAVFTLSPNLEITLKP